MLEERIDFCSDIIYNKALNKKIYCLDTAAYILELTDIKPKQLTDITMNKSRYKDMLPTEIARINSVKTTSALQVFRDFIEFPNLDIDAKVKSDVFKAVLSMYPKEFFSDYELDIVNNWR